MVNVHATKSKGEYVRSSSEKQILLWDRKYLGILNFAFYIIEI